MHTIKEIKAHHFLVNTVVPEGKSQVFEDIRGTLEMVTNHKIQTKN